MHFLLTVVVAVLSLTSSANLISRQDGLPACATTCILQADLGGCDSSDVHCLCQSQAFMNSTLKCASQNCQGQDLEDALATAMDLCATAGVTLTLTPPGSTLTGTVAGPTLTTSAAGNPTSSSGSAVPTGNGAASVNSNDIGTFVGITAIGLAVLAL